MSTRIALTRAVSPGIGQGERTHVPRVPIDVERAVRQHEELERRLAACGCHVARVPPAPDCPDSVFVEDTAVVLDELAVATRPGAPARRPEVAAVADALRAYRPVAWIEPPGTLDGGDVLRVGRTLYVGLSARTNREGAARLERLAAPYGYRVRLVEVRGALHLKSAATEVADGTVLVQPRWLPPGAFRELGRIEVDPGEPWAANALRVGDRVLHPAAFPRTRERLEARGIATLPVDVSELAKAEGGITCCALVFEVRDDAVGAE